MKGIEFEIRTFVEEIVAMRLGETVPEKIEFISIKDAARICDCDESVIQSLVKERFENDFPAAVLSKKTIRIDRIRLLKWLQAGGIKNGAKSRSWMKGNISCAFPKERERAANTSTRLFAAL